MFKQKVNAMNLDPLEWPVDSDRERMSDFMHERVPVRKKRKLILSATLLFVSGIFSTCFWWSGAGIVFLLNAVFCLICVLVAVREIYQEQLQWSSIDQQEVQPETDS